MEHDSQLAYFYDLELHETLLGESSVHKINCCVIKYLFFLNKKLKVHKKRLFMMSKVHLAREVHSSSLRFCLGLKISLLRKLDFTVCSLNHFTLDFCVNVG